MAMGKSREDVKAVARFDEKMKAAVQLWREGLVVMTRLDV